MYFLGSGKFQLDVKNRIRVPAKFRPDLGSKYVITIGDNNCLCVYSMQEFAIYMEKIKSIPVFDLESQRYVRKILSMASEVEPDDQGRFILSTALMEYAKIKKDVVVNGVGTKVEIWSEENWKAYNSADDLDSGLQVLGTKYGI